MLLFLFFQVALRLVKRYVKFPTPAFLGSVLDSDYRRFLQPPGQLNGEEFCTSRFVLMRPMVSMFYAAFLLAMVARSDLAIAEDSPVPDFRAFHQRLIADEGEAVMATPAGQLQYARVYLQEALAQGRSVQTSSQPPACG